MFFIIGNVIVIGSVISGYVLHNGNLAVLYQPTEYLIIGGAALGSFIIANPKVTLVQTLKSFKYLLKSGPPHSKQAYVELLMFMYNIFKFMKTKGMLEVESHIENPKESELFKDYPAVIGDHHATDMFCDYIRLMTMGIEDKYVLEDLLDAELEKQHHELEEIATGVMTLGDSFPALGIVAAVLGVIITMGSISEPPEILGGLVGAALVGTFLGILVAYGFVGPMGQYLGKYFNAEHKFYECIKIGLLCHVQGNAPAVSIEFARKSIPSPLMPTFKDIEQAMESA